MKTLTVLLAALLLSPLFGHADPIADLANAKCVKCHNSSADFARIDGQKPEYLVQSILDYKNKVRVYDMMFKRVVNLDDATIKGLADFFSKQPRDPAIAGDAKLIATGKDLYQGIIPGTGLRSCAECHGKNAEGGGFGSGLNPMLAGQLKDFTIGQMAVYKSGSIASQKEMNEIAQKLTDDQVKAIAEYVQSL